MATLKSSLKFEGTETLKDTVPYLSPSCGPQVTVSPLLRSGKSIILFVVLVLVLQQTNRKDEATAVAARISFRIEKVETKFRYLFNANFSPKLVISQPAPATSRCRTDHESRRYSHKVAE